MVGPIFSKTNRSAYVNFLRAKYEAYTGQVVVKSRPYYLCIDPCDICQLRCPTCPTGQENESRKTHAAEKILYRQKRSVMDGDLFDAVLEDTGEYLFLINFYNYGEPLLNKAVPSFVRKARAANIDSEIHTNLSLPLSDDQIDDLMTCGLDDLNCSIDGFTQETYQRHRVGGDLALVKRNLERLAEAKARLGSPTRITYKMLVFKFNEHEVPAAQTYCDGIGVHFISGNAFVYDRDWLPTSRQDEQPSQSQADMKAIVAEWEAAGLGDYWQTHEKREAWLAIVPFDKEGAPSYCAWHYGYSVVTAGGPVAPCCAVAKERDDFGTVAPGEVSFGDVWNNDHYQSARAAFAGRRDEAARYIDTVCARCYFPKFVQHLYSGHDIKVFTQFNKVFGDVDPVLKQAFALWVASEVIFENRSEIARTKFADFFKAHLIDDFSTEGRLDAMPLSAR